MGQGTGYTTQLGLNAEAETARQERVTTQAYGQAPRETATKQPDTQ